MEVRGNEIVIVAASARDSGAGFAQALRARHEELRGEHVARVNIGIGLDLTDVAELPRSYVEAQKALDLTSAASLIVRLAEIAMNDYPLRRAEMTAIRLIPSWVEKLLDEDRKTKGELTLTVQSFGEWSLNVGRSAERLKLHANSVYFRLNRVQEIAGVDRRSLGDLTAILTALRLLAREPPPGFRIRAREARSDRPARLSRPRGQRVVKALPPTDA